MAGQVVVVGIGPGERSLLTPLTSEALKRADVLIGYANYLNSIADLVGNKERLSFPLGQEVERARAALERAASGATVCVVSSGDPGIYAMAGVVLELLETFSDPPEVTVLPGVSALTACAARLGAPLAHDFAVISLSDLLTPWSAIEGRLRAAAQADFVTAVLNPKSKRRDWQLARAREIFREHREPRTPVGIVRNAFRPDEAVVRTTLDELKEADVDMFSTLIVGNSRTRRVGDYLVTPRGYLDKPSPGATIPETLPRGLDDSTPSLGSRILAESFHLIERAVGSHGFSEDEWPIVRRMIHASGDTEILRDVIFHKDPIASARSALREGRTIVTDVTMVAAGINKEALGRLGLEVRCYLDQVPEGKGTRSAAAMKHASAQHPGGIFVVGNAPTALMALVEAIRDGIARPALIIAMPVGFVGVVESKGAALALDVPVIALRGRKGGSAMAAAALNAILREDRP